MGSGIEVGARVDQGDVRLGFRKLPELNRVLRADFSLLPDKTYWFRNGPPADFSRLQL